MDELPGYTPYSTAEASRLDRDGLDERGQFRDQKPLNGRERSGRRGAPQCPPPEGPLGSLGHLMTFEENSLLGLKS